MSIDYGPSSQQLTFLDEDDLNDIVNDHLTQQQSQFNGFQSQVDDHQLIDQYVSQYQDTGRDDSVSIDGFV